MSTTLPLDRPWAHTLLQRYPNLPARWAKASPSFYQANLAPRLDSFINALSNDQRELWAKIQTTSPNTQRPSTLENLVNQIQPASAPIPSLWTQALDVDETTVGVVLSSAVVIPTLGYLFTQALQWYDVPAAQVLGYGAAILGSGLVAREYITDAYLAHRPVDPEHGQRRALAESLGNWSAFYMTAQELETALQNPQAFREFLQCWALVTLRDEKERALTQLAMEPHGAGLTIPDFSEIDALLLGIHQYLEGEKQTPYAA